MIEDLAKTGSHELKGLVYCRSTMKDTILNFPVATIIDYRGFRLIAMSLLPINKETLMYGSDDGGFSKIHSKLKGKSVHYSDEKLNKEMEEVYFKLFV